MAFADNAKTSCQKTVQSFNMTNRLPCLCSTTRALFPVLKKVFQFTDTQCNLVRIENYKKRSYIHNL